MKTKTILITIILSFFWINLSSYTITVESHKEWAADVNTTIKEIKNLLIIGTIESHFNDKALNMPENAAGIFQIRKIMLSEVNRILGKKVYSDSCRFNARKSIEMFLIIQRTHNPSANFKTACKLWNAGKINCPDSTITNYWNKASKTMNKMF
jgi:hypothetical protein